MKRHSDLRRLSRDKAHQAVILTNQDTLAHSPMQIYENDFDLYTLLKEMVGSKHRLDDDDDDSRGSEQPKPPRPPKNQFKDYKKMLTATLLPTHFVDGRWPFQSIAE